MIHLNRQLPALPYAFAEPLPFGECPIQIGAFSNHPCVKNELDGLIHGGVGGTSNSKSDRLIAEGEAAQESGDFGKAYMTFQDAITAYEEAQQKDTAQWMWANQCAGDAFLCMWGARFGLASLANPNANSPLTQETNNGILARAWQFYRASASDVANKAVELIEASEICDPHPERAPLRLIEIFERPFTEAYHTHKFLVAIIVSSLMNRGTEALKTRRGPLDGLIEAIACFDFAAKGYAYLSLLAGDEASEIAELQSTADRLFKEHLEIFLPDDSE